ncbi:MAG: phosphatidylglycerophosphatase A [Candidatus Paracaedibacteraceae bacterium]|nr:phosphatidylglycerophosphatase A [Candidatus Paracaedibacteraceae bacterium]
MIPAFNLIASSFGLGKLPWFPGTWGTLGAFFISLFILQQSCFSWFILSLVTTIIGFFASEFSLKAESYNNTDPSWIVIDEVAGYFWAVALISFVRPIDVVQLTLAFIFFRIFDITKPWPISWVDKALAQSHKTAALGIMLDDVLAGIFAALFTIFTCYAFK